MTEARLWHPWLRINRLLRVMLHTRWSAEAWPQAKAEFKGEVSAMDDDQKRAFDFVQSLLDSYGDLTAILVGWQLDNRRFAARMVAACTTVASRWLTQKPERAEYTATELNHVFWPDAIVREFHRVSSTATLVLMVVIPSAILVWGGIVVCYVYYLMM